MAKYCNISDKKIRAQILQKYDGKCAYCGEELTPKKFTVDHIVPKRRDLIGTYGEDNFENYNPCCYSCNSSKGTWTLDEWRREIALKIPRLIRDSSQMRLLVRFGVIEVPEQPEVIFHFETYSNE